ncbi:MAG: preprotein translocase subunit SecA [Pseudomonadota bacterium]|nr:preprotein translocase subunit SecA [Pseudomonadota bacterium]
MFQAIANKILGRGNERILRGYSKSVDAVNALEPEFEKLSNADIRAKTDEFRKRIAGGESLDHILPEAFATVREAAKRTIGQRHYDVQLLGGVALHKGQVAEMKTGEGKTLVATLAVYLNSLEGKGVYVVTVNDYLARRDAEWMNQIYGFLGLTVGVIVPGLDEAERRAAYASDVIYGTNNELGFDYLRDNMKYRLQDMVQRPYNFAIVDEVDSILIDEARTPLMISGPSLDSSEHYKATNRIIPKLHDDDYEMDEKVRSVVLTDIGVERVEELLKTEGVIKSGSLYDLDNLPFVHHVTQAIRAHKLFHKDTDYVLQDEHIVIIDEFSGRMMPGRRFGEGLHQALEAKEGMEIQRENQTLASITFQNFFRMFPKLAGMTGTAMTEAAELSEIYQLDVIAIPTNMSCVRVDHNDEIYRTAGEKSDAILHLIRECHERDQPVLIGTTSIEKSEILSALLKKNGIKHNVLNARNHTQEAQIIALAGCPGSLTIATNMAGRGVDIQLGGNLEMRLAQEAAQIEDEAKRKTIEEKIHKEVEAGKAIAIEAGGLYVLGTERHESRRIDNQLRGRAGRQGDPGTSKFFLSLEDDLMRIFGSERMDRMLVTLGLKDGEAIVHPWISKMIERAQQKVEAHNFAVRKSVLDYDDVMNDQRKVIYERRKEIMTSVDVSEDLRDLRIESIEMIVDISIPSNSYPEQWDLDGLHAEGLRLLGLDMPINDWANEEGIAEGEIVERMIKAADEKMASKAANYGADVWRSVENALMLQILDQTWMRHLQQLDHLRQGINLRAYGQRNPLHEYRSEAFEMFRALLNQFRDTVTSVLCRVELTHESENKLKESPQGPARTMSESHGDTPASIATAQPVHTRTITGPVDPNDPQSWGRVSRNAPCPCGSGKKYKRCHGALA